MPLTARAAVAALAVCLAACSDLPPPAPVVAGDIESGRLLLRQYGCGACHAIPGVATADGTVGPPLDRIARRVYLAGSLPNTPANLAQFIRDPQSAKPQTTMPDLGVGERHATDMVAYLYTLR